LHASQTIKAAEAGKHVLCEKPMALNMDECLRMVESCKRNNVKLMIGHHMRFKPDNNKIREIISDGLIGDVVLIRAEHSGGYMLSKPDPTAWRLNPSLGGGGPLMDLGVHCIDLLRFILQKDVVEVAALTYNVIFSYPVEDTSVVLMKFENNSCGIVSSCFNIRYPKKILDVYGTEGSILGIGTIGPRSGILKVITKKGEETYEFKEMDPYLAELEHFTECIEKDKDPIISGEECLGTMKAVFGAYESSRTGKTIKL